MSLIARNPPHVVASDEHDFSTPTTLEGSNTERVLKELNKMRLRGIFCDAVISTEDGASFRVHKTIMSWCSNYFRTLFTTCLKDDSSGEGQDSRTFFVIPNLSSENLETFVRYAYSGIADVNKNNVNALLAAADQFDFSGIVSDCKRFMLKHMTPENYIGVWRFGKEYLMPELEVEARRCIQNNFMQMLLTSDELLHISMENLKEILQYNNLNVPNELFVWIAIKRWCQFKYQKRQYLIPSLLMCVRLAMLPVAEFKQIVRDPRICTDAHCMKYVTMVAKYMMKKHIDVREVFQDQRAETMFTPRYPFELMFAIGGWNQNGPANVFEVYDHRADLWKMMFVENSLGPLTNHQTVALGEYMYVLGGATETDILNDCWRFDTRTLKFEEIPPMLKHRHYHCAVLLSDKIYVIGGHSGHDRLKSVEFYDPDQNQWTFVSPMHEIRSDFGAAVVRNRIFVVGGHNGAGCKRDVECYFAEFDQWFVLPPLMRCRAGLGCVATEDAIYAVGGYEGVNRLNSVEKYCIKARQWIPAKPMTLARSNFAVTVMDKKIYVLGGLKPNTENDTETYESEVFDLTKLQWHSIAPLTVARYGFACCAISGLKNIGSFIKEDRFRCVLKYVSTEEQDKIRGGDSSNTST